jgi:DNA topoisomerase-1
MLTVDKALAYIYKQAAGPKALGTDPTTGLSVYVLEGRFGPYVQLGEKPKVEKTAGKKSKAKVKKPKMKGLLRGMTVTDTTLETALQLLHLPREVGVYAKTGEPIVADAGRFGPYIRCGNETRSLKADDNLLTLTLERATELLDTPKLRGGRGSAMLKTLGDHPTLKKPIELYTGKFGPYVKCGKINATVPKDSSVDTLTLETAIALISKKVKRA